MTALGFMITFNGPFRVATGVPTAGFDVAVGDDPLPASSLKGAMRATARRVVGPDHWLIGEIFGTEGDASPWSWSSAHFDTAVATGARTRIAIDDDTHTVIENALVRSQHYEAATATYQIEATGPIPAGQVDHHRDVLVAAARGTQSLGADRNRGFGWVTISHPAQPDDVAQLARRITALRTTPAPERSSAAVGVGS